MAETTQSMLSKRRFGVGPKWGLPTIVYFVATIILHQATYPKFVITQVSIVTCVVVGVLLVVIGTCAFLTAFISLRRSKRNGVLVTNGLYAVTRHPLYASWIFFIIPGISVVFRSWILLPTTVVAYVAACIVLPAEELALRERYGEEFDRYRAKTNTLFFRCGSMLPQKSDTERKN